MKLSRYVAVAVFKQNKVPLMLCYHLVNNKMMVLSASAASVLNHANFTALKLDDVYVLRNETADCRMAADTYQLLIQDRFIVDDGFDEVKAVVEANQQFITTDGTLAIVIQVSGDCSCKCVYCGQGHSPVTLGMDKIDKIVERIKLKLQKNFPRFKKLDIRWFGGEPLLNLPAIVELSKRLRIEAERYQAKYHSIIVTNGVALTLDVVGKLYECAIDKIEVTLDGDERDHNLRRPTKLGGESFAIVYHNLLEGVRRYGDKIDFTVRCNVDKGNSQAILKLIDRLCEDNVQDRINLYVAPLHSWGNRADLRGLTPKEFAEFELEVLVKLQRLGFYNASGVLPRRKFVPCMAVGTENECIDPDGAVFHCTEVSLVPSYVKKGINCYQVADIADDKFEPKGIDFRSKYEEILATKTPCLECQLLPVCAGACPKLWYEGLTPCPSVKLNLEQRLVLSYLFSNEGEKICAQIAGKAV